jgi:hypothetical protein
VKATAAVAGIAAIGSGTHAAQTDKSGAGDGHSDTRWHAILVSYPAGALESPNVPLVWRAACGIRRPLKRSAAPTPIGEVPLYSRCLRPGCRGRWAKRSIV